MFQADSCYKVTHLTAFVTSVKGYIEDREEKRKRGRGWKEIHKGLLPLGNFSHDGGGCRR